MVDKYTWKGRQGYREWKTRIYGMIDKDRTIAHTSLHQEIFLVHYSIPGREELV